MVTFQVNCRIPSPCLDPALEVTKQVLARIPELLAQGVVPIKVPAGAGNHTVRITPELAAELEAVGQRHGMVLGRVVGGLLYADYLKGVTPKGAKASVSLAPNTDHLRPGQVRCITEAAPHLSSGKIVLSECGTGSGKSRIIAHAAAYILALRDAGQQIPAPYRFEAQAPSQGPALLDKWPDFMRAYGVKAQAIQDQRMEAAEQAQPRAVIVAAPSVENLSHLAREWARVQPHLDPAGKYVVRVLLGKGQFVSPSRLRELLANAEEAHPAVEKWLEDGMPPGQIPSTQYLAALQTLAPGDVRLAGLMADLEHLAAASDFACRDAAMDEDSPKDESDLYRELRDQARAADLVFTSTAMLALDNARLLSENQAALLPQPLALFVDEAHMLESIQANVTAKSLSFQRLLSELKSPYWAEIRKATQASEAITRAKTLMAKLALIPHETMLPILDMRSEIGRMWSDSTSARRELQAALAGLCKGIVKAKVENTQTAKYIFKALAALEQIDGSHKGHIEQSPRRGCLSFVVGPTSVDRFLLARWATTPCAMLLSGTLLQVGQTGDASRATFKELTIPVSRGVSTTPAHPSWLASTPTVYQPSLESFHRFMPPQYEDVSDPSFRAWVSECARAIHYAAQDAKGGMLVLMTSYERLESLGEVLAANYPSLEHRLLRQGRASRMMKHIPAFKEMARAGLRPIWLATGSAWLGLDLADEQVSDAEAHRDMILTDLVMPNVPFGLNRTTMHVSKVARLGFGTEINATQRMFRQGLGRGVRRAGLEDRRFWILDGRLLHPATAGYTSPMRKVLTGYLKRASFDLG